MTFTSTCRQRLETHGRQGMGVGGGGSGREWEGEGGSGREWEGGGGRGREGKARGGTAGHSGPVTLAVTPAIHCN